MVALRHESLFNRDTKEPLGEAASLALSKMLLAQHARPELICRFARQPGSIAFWDNRAVQHYAASDYYPHTRSIRRVTLSGDASALDAKLSFVVIRKFSLSSVMVAGQPNNQAKY